MKIRLLRPVVGRGKLTDQSSNCIVTYLRTSHQPWGRHSDQAALAGNSRTIS